MLQGRDTQQLRPGLPTDWGSGSNATGDSQLFGNRPFDTSADPGGMLLVHK